MVRSHLAIEINRPVAEVYAFLMDVGTYVLWQSGLLELRASDGMNVDSTLIFTSVGLGQKLHQTAVITANNGISGFAAKSIRGPITIESAYELTAIPAGTRLALANNINTNGFFRLAEPVLQTMGDVKFEADLQSLKAILEADVSLRGR